MRQHQLWIELNNIYDEIQKFFKKKEQCNTLLGRSKTIYSQFSQGPKKMTLNLEQFHEFNFFLHIEMESTFDVIHMIMDG